MKTNKKTVLQKKLNHNKGPKIVNVIFLQESIFFLVTAHQFSGLDKVQHLKLRRNKSRPTLINDPIPSKAELGETETTQFYNKCFDPLFWFMTSGKCSISLF